MTEEIVLRGRAIELIQDILKLPRPSERINLITDLLIDIQKIYEKERKRCES